MNLFVHSAPWPPQARPGPGGTELTRAPSGGQAASPSPLAPGTGNYPNYLPACSLQNNQPDPETWAAPTAGLILKGLFILSAAAIRDQLLIKKCQIPSSFEGYFQLDIMSNMQKTCPKLFRKKSCFSERAVAGKNVPSPAMSAGSQSSKSGRGFSVSKTEAFYRK